MFSLQQIFKLAALATLSNYSLFAGDADGQFCDPGGVPFSYVFKSGENGYKCYRIPAIVQSTKGTLIAFAEGRVNGSGDHGNLDIVARRSTDGGKTWGDLIIVQDDGNNQCGNPAPVVDRKSGRIFLLSCGSTASEGAVMDGKASREIYLQYSNNDGRTWSKRINISTQAKKQDWRWYATGPCSGIQIMQGKHKGRLVIPANHSDSARQYQAHCIYSDDSGKTWKIGDSAEAGSNESQIAELGPDSLVHNMRMQTHGKGLRTTRTSNDGGATWTPLEHDSNLPCPVCQASVARDYATPHTLYFSNPAAIPRSRKGMTIRTSTDGGQTWPYAKTVYTGPSGYSNLIILAPGKVGILFEGGIHDLCEGIAFRSFNKSALLTQSTSKEKAGK